MFGIKAIPVADRMLQIAAHSHVKALLSIPQHMPFAVPQPQAWIDARGNGGKPTEFVPVKKNTQRGLLAWLPGETQLLLFDGSIYHSHHIPKPRACVNDSTDGPAPCSLYRGTVLGVDVEEKSPFTLYANDVFAIKGESIVDEPYAQRKKRLERILLCVPGLQIAAPDADSNRMYDEHGCLWKEPN